MTRVRQYVVLCACACGCGQPTWLAPRNDRRCGHRIGQPVRYIHNHHVRPGNSMDDYFWGRLVTTPTGCQEWRGSCDMNGYGRIHYQGKPSAYTHRIAYELTHGPIPDGLIVRHKCDNPPCANPDHLEVGTLADNNQDRKERGGYLLTGIRGAATRAANAARIAS